MSENVRENVKMTCFSSKGTYDQGNTKKYWTEIYRKL